jgi:hypothetical protein
MRGTNIKKEKKKYVRHIMFPVEKSMKIKYNIMYCSKIQYNTIQYNTQNTKATVLFSSCCLLTISFPEAGSAPFTKHSTLLSALTHLNKEREIDIISDYQEISVAATSLHQYTSAHSTQLSTPRHGATWQRTACSLTVIRTIAVGALCRICVDTNWPTQPPVQWVPGNTRG